MEALIEDPKNGSLKDWMCGWMEATLRNAAGVVHVLPKFFVGTDPAYPRGVLKAEMRSGPYMYELHATLYFSAKDSLDLQMSLGSEATGSLSVRKALPADSYPSAVAQALKAFVGPALRDLNLKQDSE
jgi:hypothetical protein